MGTPEHLEHLKKDLDDVKWDIPTWFLYKTATGEKSTLSVSVKERVVHVLSSLAKQKNVADK